ncbi:MAG: NfeD family protein [Planctomycetia bacterium]|nr:NfeD family protein [Planctomycetia bacterium]
MELITCLLIWVTLAVLFIILEISCPTLISIWFVLGAITSMVAATQEISFLGQCAIFVGSSTVFLIATRPFVKSLKIQKVPTNADELVGMEGLVQIPVDNIKAEGRVLINGIDWAAKSTHGNIIPAGNIVVVDRLEGVTIFVTKKPAQNE